jgi:hypothetical protein
MDFAGLQGEKTQAILCVLQGLSTQAGQQKTRSDGVEWL